MQNEFFAIHRAVIYLHEHRMLVRTYLNITWMEQAIGKNSRILGNSLSFENRGAPARGHRSRNAVRELFKKWQMHNIKYLTYYSKAR